MQHPPLDQQSIPTICDIGPGNGVLLGDIVNLIFKNLPITQLRVLLCEPSTAMLQESTKDLAEERFGSGVQCIPICQKIEEITYDDFAKYSGSSPLWFTNGAGSLHHMPAAVKTRVLTMLRQLSTYLLVTDFVANNDLTKFNLSFLSEPRSAGLIARCKN